jgi:hypothetical protein
VAVLARLWEKFMSDKSIKLNLTKTDAKHAKAYSDMYGCLLATALKRRFPHRRVWALAYTCSIGDREFVVSDCRKIKDAYGYKFYNTGVCQPFQPFTVTLTPK